MGDAAPAGNRGVLSLKAYPGAARMARLSPPPGSQASLKMQTSLAEPIQKYSLPFPAEAMLPMPCQICLVAFSQANDGFGTR